jgi:hypothetical protein
MKSNKQIITIQLTYRFKKTSFEFLFFKNLKELKMFIADNFELFDIQEPEFSISVGVEKYYNNHRTIIVKYFYFNSKFFQAVFYNKV